jgi:hypothetical protein
METLLKGSQPIASNHLIELVDRVMERHPHKGNFRSRPKLFPWLRRDLVRPSMNRPSQKINHLLSPEPSARLMQKADSVTHPSCQPEAA